MPCNICMSVLFLAVYSALQQTSP